MTRIAAVVLVVLAHSAAAMMLPSLGGSTASGALNGVDVLQCATVVAPLSITATKLAGFRAAGVGTLGVSIYPDADSGTQLGEATSAAGNPTATGLSIVLVAGTRYRICACGSATTANYLALGQDTGSPGRLPDMLNAGAFPTTVGTAANACTAGDPPPTTGAITAVISFKIPLLWLE